jgi:oligopeptide transport system substrate-binding protein
MPTIASPQFGKVLDHPDILRFPILGTYHYIVNTTRPALNNLRIRKALYLAVQRGNICRTVLESGYLPAFGFVPPRIPGYTENHGNRENPELARQLLEETGYPDGQGIPELSLLCLDYEENRMIAEAIQATWQKELNIQVRVEPHASQTFWQRVADRDFDLLAFLWVGDYVDPSTFLDMFQSASHDNNLTGWERHEYHALIQQAEAEIQPEKRLQLYARAEQILLEEVPVLPLFHAVSAHLLKPYVHGIYPNLMNLHPLKKVKITR